MVMSLKHVILLKIYDLGVQIDSKLKSAEESNQIDPWPSELYTDMTINQLT